MGTTEKKAMTGEVEEAKTYLRSLLTSFVHEHCDPVDNAITVTRDRQAEIARLREALEPFAALIPRLPMAADHVEVAALNGDLCDQYVDECLSLKVGDFRRAITVLSRPNPQTVWLDESGDISMDAYDSMIAEGSQP